MAAPDSVPPTPEALDLRRLTLTLEAARTGTWQWFSEDRRIVVDEGWLQIAGRRPGEGNEFTVAQWEQLVHPDDLPAWEALRKSVAGGDQLALDTTLRMSVPSGRWDWFRIRGKVSDSDAEGRPLRVLGTLEDVTETVQTEQERAILSQVVEQGPSAVILTDPTGRIEYVNRQFSVLSGYSWNEVQGQNPRLLKSPSTPMATYVDLWSSLRAGRPWYGELQNLRKDGRPYWVQTSISPIVDASGRVYRYAGQQIDITTRKLVEEASRAQYEFQVFLTRISDQLLTVRGEAAVPAVSTVLGDLARHFHADRCFLGFLGKSEPVLNVRAAWNRTGTTRLEAIDLRSAPLWLRRIKIRETFQSRGLPCPVPWAQVPCGGLLLVPLEGGYGDPGCLVIEADGPRPGWGDEVQVSLTVVANTLSAYLRRVVDEEDLRKARTEAEEANQAKSEFLAHMSHEIRTPMSGILGLADLVLGQNLPPDSRSLVEGIQASGRALLSLVSDILDVSKIEAGKLELEMTPFSLKEVVQQTLHPLEVLALQKGLSLETTWGPSLSDRREGDPTRWRQILTNLVGNALKFTSQGGILVAVEGTGPDRVRVSVTDTGPGVPRDRVHRLFHRFSQIEASTTRHFGGTGLGLAICRELAEKMEGAVGYEDALPGPGAVFWFETRLPTLPDLPKVERTPEPASSARFPGLRVLVVEDNPVNQQVAAGMLRNLGVNPVMASGGIEALDALVNGAFDIVLMDVQMPGMDGYATTRAIRRGEGGDLHRRVPVVAMTANAMASDREVGLEAGMDDYLTKPVFATKLVALLEKFRPAAGVERPPRKVFDSTEMKSRLQIDDALLGQIVAMFLADVPARRSALEWALATGNLEELGRLAHTLRGTAANLVAEAVVDAGQALELAVRESHLSALPRLQAGLVAELDRLEEALKAYTDGAR
jgi:PAS domain S-box-containing protein